MRTGSECSVSKCSSKCSQDEVCTKLTVNDEDQYVTLDYEAGTGILTAVPWGATPLAERFNGGTSNFATLKFEILNFAV